MNSNIKTLFNTKKPLRAALLAAFAITMIGAGVKAAYAHGQQGDDCPPGSTDPDCKKK